jgi:peptide deformylase
MSKVVKYPALILLEPTKEVKEFDRKLHSLLMEMKEAMLAEKGIGLAANQINRTESVFIMLSQSQYKHGTTEVIEFINPKIIFKSKEMQRLSEGCLSAPGLFLQIPRHEEIHVQYNDRYGNIKEGILIGIEAVCAQHEIDHLNGIFYTDKVSRQERKAALKILGLK